jgi:membrane associated rhomboid family serine protease
MVQIDLNYIYALLPIVISHLAVPPLSLLEGNESIEQLSPWFASIVEAFYLTAPPQLLSRRYVQSLCCDMNSEKSIAELIDSGDATRLSYLLVHADYGHMLSNLRAIATFGYPVYRQLGPGGLHALYLLGGVAAIWPSPLHNKTVRQRAAVLEDTLVDMVPGFARALLPEYVQSHAYRVGSFLTGKVLDALPRIACGSSGAACALLGASLVFEVRELWALWGEMFPSTAFGGVGRRLDGRKGASGVTAESRFTLARLWRLWHHALYLANVMSYMSQEVTMLAMSREALFELSKRYGFFSVFSIGHSAHVQGCLFGLSVGLWNLL